MKTKKAKNLMEWLTDLENVLRNDWESKEYHRPFGGIKVTKGRKFAKVKLDGMIWGFVSMVDGEHCGAPVKKGDLMKPANRNAAAKHARGNIFDGTANFSYYGPAYLI